MAFYSRWPGYNRVPPLAPVTYVCCYVIHAGQLADQLIGHGGHDLRIWAVVLSDIRKSEVVTDSVEVNQAKLDVGHFC